MSDRRRGASSCRSSRGGRSPPRLIVARLPTPRSGSLHGLHQHLRHLQDRRGAVQLAHDGAVAGGAAVPGRLPGAGGARSGRAGAGGPVRLAGEDGPGARDGRRGDPGALRARTRSTCDPAPIHPKVAEVRAVAVGCRWRAGGAIAFRSGRGLVFHADDVLAVPPQRADVHRHARRRRDARGDVLLDRRRLRRAGGRDGAATAVGGSTLPFPIETAADLLRHCRRHGLTIPEVVWRNELAWRTTAEIRDGLARIWETMRDCVVPRLHTPRASCPGAWASCGARPRLRRTLLGAVGRRRRRRRVDRGDPASGRGVPTDPQVGQLLRPGGQRGERGVRPRGHRADQRRRGRDPGRAAVRRLLPRRRRRGGIEPLPAHGRRDRQHVQEGGDDLGGDGRLPGRDRRLQRHGGRRAWPRCLGRLAEQVADGRRDRAWSTTSG